jgi:hypothetical protein
MLSARTGRVSAFASSEEEFARGGGPSRRARPRSRSLAGGRVSPAGAVEEAAPRHGVVSGVFPTRGRGMVLLGELRAKVCFALPRS